MSTLQQGYLQYIPAGSDQAQKVFVNITPQEIAIYPEDPAKLGQSVAPISRFNLQKIQLVDSGDFQRPKSFGVLTERGNLIEFSCPTNSVRSAWIKSIGDFSAGSSNPQAATLKIPGTGGQPATMDIYRTPVNSYKIPHPSNGGNNPNRFSDFDGFANQALSQLNSLKTGGGPATNTGVPRPTPSAASFANPTRLNPAARVVKPSISRGAAPPPPQPNYSNPAPPTQPAPVLVAPQPAIRKTPAARSNNNVSSQQANKPQPKWLPGHYKATALVNNPKNPSPQRARNNYTQNQPQQASTLLGRSLSAPGYNANANHVSEPHQQQFYQSEPAGFPAQQTQYSQSHNHQQQSYNQQQVVQPQQGLPLEKMTLEQLRSAFMNMPEEIKTAITGNPASQPGSRKPSAHREREYNSDSDEYNGRREKERNQRNTRAESNNRRNREQDTYREPASDEEEQYRSKSRRESRERAEREREKERIDREKERERERSRSRQKAREYSSESNDSYEKRPQRRSSRSKYQTESNDEDYREDQGESDRRFSSSARALAYDEEEEDRFELPQKTNYERHSMPSRLDYTDHIEHDDEEYEEVAPLRARDLEYSDFQRRRPAAEEDDRLPRYMRSKEKEKTQPEKERTNRSNSNPKGTKTKPPLERSRSAPPPSSAARDFSSKSKSTVPRGDLLEWSKKQAWQKHVSTGFPMSKAQEKAKDIYKTMSQPSVKSKDPRDARLPVEASRSVPAEPAGRSSSQRMKALEDNMARSNLGAPNKPTPATPGSFFDFMKSRGAPVPAGLKNISQSRENVRNGGTSKENHRRESLAQQEDKLQTKNYKMTFPSPDQISAGLNHTEKQFPSSSRTPPQKNTTHQHQPQNTKQGAKKNSSPPEKQPKKNGDYISFDQMKRPQVSASNKLQQHRHSHDDASTISVSTQSVLRAERPQSQQNILQSNSSTPLTDVAEWQRVTNWLTSIRMERYIPTFREHGVTKLSLIELLTEEAFWELGIDPNDIPVIKQKVAEFSARIKSFSEEGALFTSITAAQRLQKGKPVAVDEDIDEGEEEEEVGLVLGAADPPLRRAASQREVVKAKKFIPISDIQAFQLDLFQAFDYGRYSSFIEMWERFLHYYLPSSTLTLTQPSEDVNFTQQRPALFYAKQAMEFHLFVYFYVYAIRKSLSKEEISVTRRALKEYLEGLAVQYETFHPLLEEKVFALGQPPHTNSIITTTTDNNYPHSSSAVIEESVGLPVSAVASSLNESQIEIGPESPPKPLITSREFATFAGLVFVPNPQYNPAFQTLFTDDWAQALRQRLTQFVAILIEEFEKMRAKDPLIALSEASLIQSEKPILAPLKTIKEPLSLVRPSEIDQRRTFEDEIVQQNEKGVGNLLLQTAEISPIYPAGPSDRNELPLADRLASDQHQPRVHNLLPPTSTLLQQSEQYHSFERPVESPQSNCSTISQLTDDTPLKSDAHRNSARKSAQKPSSSAAIDPVVVPAPAFTFGKTSSSALADAANRANVRLKNLQSQSNGVTAPNPAPVIAVLGANPSNGNGSTLKPRISPSPPKSSLQMQVDNYNKLLKQNRLSKTSQPATSLLASSSMEIQQQTNNLLEEMHLPANKDLLNQIDAIIAPINQPVANSQINSNQPQTIPSNTRGFNLGVAVPRPVPVTSNPLPIPALDNSALADQVNRYKSLLKGSSKTASVSSNEERRGSSPSATREPEVGKEIPESLNSRTVEKPKDITKAFEPAEVAIINEQPVRAEDESLPESEESFPESEKEESFPPSIQEIAESAKFEVLDKDEAEKEEVVEEDITLKQVTETDVEGTNFTTERELHSDDGEVNEDNSELLEEDAIDKVNVEKEEEHQIAVIEKVEEVAVQEAEEEDHQIAVIEKVEEVAVQEAEEEDHQIAVIEKVEEVAVQETEEEDHQIAVIEEELHEVEEKKDEALVAPTDDNHEDKETTVESQLPLVNVTSHDDLKPSEQDLPLINAEEQRREEENLGEIKEAEAFPATDRVSSPSNFDQVTEPLLKSDEVIEEKVEITETVIEAEESFLVEEDAPDVEDTTNINTGSNPTTKSNKKKKKRRKSTVK